MASPPSLDRTLFTRDNNHAPPIPSPLSPFSHSDTPSIPPPASPAPPLDSHYYRPPRSSHTSPTRSNISSPAGSPTRTSRQTRIQSLLATDPLLSRLTPLTISRLSNDPEFAFTPAEREWSLRASEGIVKVGEWLREVEGWNLEWRKAGAGKGRESGVGYLPPSRDRPKKRRRVSVGAGEMGSIKEEVETESEEEEEGTVGKRSSLRRKLFIDRSTDTSDNEDGKPPMRRGKASVESLNGKPSRKPLTPYQLKLQRQGAEANGETIAKETPVKRADRPIHEEYDGESTDEDEEGVEYWGSLKRTTIEHYLERIELIKSEIEELDVEALKSKVLAYRTGITNPLTDSSAIITAITLQLLPPLHRLTKLLSAWAVRLAVLRIVPVFLRWLQIAKDALDAGYAAINHPSISPKRLSSPDHTSWRGLEEETYTLMQETITQKVTTAGKLMDTMLDALEGREDVLPDLWITELEDVEERVSAWEMDGERVVLEGRLRLEELRHHESRREEQQREQERTRLIIEQERFVEEARGAESVVESVMVQAEETERGLREAMEANEDVAEGIELVGDEDAEGSGAEDEGEPRVINELLMRLEGVEQERLFSTEASDSEAEEVKNDDDHADTESISSLGGSYVDILPGQHQVPMPHHGLSLGDVTQPDFEPGSTVFHTPMPTPHITQEELANADRKVSDATDYYTPMPTPGVSDPRPESSTGSTTPTQFHTPMPTPLMPPFQQERPGLQRNPSTPFHTPMPTPSLMTAFQQGPPILRRQPSMPFMPVPKLPPTAQVFTATARREPPSPETPKTPKRPELEREVKRTSPAILTAARNFFRATKEEDTKEARAKKEEEAKKEEARKREEEEREMIAAVDAETERLAKLEAAEKDRAAKVKAVRERLAEAEKLREMERASREIEEKKKVAEAERKRLVEEEERRKKAEIEAARIKAEEEVKFAEEEAERLRRASIERVDCLAAAGLTTEAEEQRILAQEAAIFVEEVLQAEDEEEQHRIAEEERMAAEAEAGVKTKRQSEFRTKEEAELQMQAARVKAEEEAKAEAELKQLAEEEAWRERMAEIERFAAIETANLAAEAESQRLAKEEEAERARQAEIDRLAAIEAARVKAEHERQAEVERLEALETARIAAEDEHLRLAEEEAERVRQIEADRIAALEAARVKAEEEAEKGRQAEADRLAALEAARLEAEEAERQRQAEIERLEAIEAARLKAEAEEERLRLIEEEEERQHQAEADRIEALEAARLKAEEERLRLIREDEDRIRQAEAARVAAIEAARAEAAAERRRAALEESEAKRQIEVQRVAALATARLQAEEEQRKQAEIEQHAALEAARLKAEAEAEAERLRVIEMEAEQQRQAEAERLAAIEAARIKAEEEERVRLAEEEAERQRQAQIERAAALEAARLKAEAEVEAERLRVIEEEAAQLKAEAEAAAERRRLAEEEAERQHEAEIERLTAIEANRRRALEAAHDAEVERQRLIEEEAEGKRQADIQHLAALEAARIKAEAEAAEQNKRAEEEVARQRKDELQRLATIENARIAEQEAENQRMAKLEDDRRRAIEEEARRNAGAHAEAVRRAEEEIARQREAEIERLAAIEAARVAREEAERQRMAQLEAERLIAIEQEAENERRIALEAERLRAIEQEAEKQRLAALEAARLEAEAEAERQRILELERKAEIERLAAIAAAEEAERQRIAEEAKRQEEQVRLAAEAEQKRLAELEVQKIAEAEAQKAENERLARLAAEAEVEAERQRIIEEEEEEIRKQIAEKQARWLAEEEEEARRQSNTIDEQRRRQIAEQEARWEAEDEEERRMIAQLQKEAMEAAAKAEREQEEVEEEIRRRIAVEQERMDSEDEEELRMIAQIQKAALEAEAEEDRQHAIEIEKEQRRIADYEARCAAEEEADEKRIAEEIERERLRELEQEREWEAEEQEERRRIATAIAAIEAANAAEEIQKARQEEEIHQRIADQERNWIADEEMEQKRFAEADSYLTFEELDRKRRLAEDERQRAADLDLVRRERERLEAQEAERLKMEKEIEDARVKAEELRKQEDRKQAQFSNHQGSNSEGDSISGDDITEDYQDVSSMIQPVPLKEADEDSGSENMAYAEARKNQPSVPPPSVSMTPVTSRSSSVMDEMKYKTPETTEEVSSTPWSPGSGLEITPGASKSREDISEASSSDLDENLVAVENLAAHNSLQKALNDSVEYELPRDMRDSDHDISESSFNEMPSILVAPSTPQNDSDFEDSKDTSTTVWDHAVSSPVFDDGDSSPGSFVDASFPSDINIDENDYPQLSMEDYEPEDNSDFDMVPIETSTPKHKRRPGMLGGLDSITEVLTPNSPRDEYFRPSDTNAFGTPSKKTGKTGGLLFPGFSSQGSPTSRRRSFNDQQKVAPISLNLGIGKQTVSSQNKLAVKRGTTPEPKAPIKAEKSQKFARKAPLDMARPRSLSSTGHYSSTTKPAPKAAPQKAPLGPSIRAIRRPRMEIDSDDEGSVVSEQRWSRSKENTPDFHSSPSESSPVPRLNISKRHIQKPSNLTTQVTPDKGRRPYYQRGSQDEEGSESSQSIPQTPRLEFPQISLDDKVNEILTSLPSPVRLTASNLQKLSEASSKRQPPLRPFELATPTGIPAPRSVGSSSMVSDATTFARGGRRYNSSIPGDIKLYHLHRNDGQSPIKLYIRLVGERGERVMVRVGGGWADLAEYLKEYATHHGSKRRVVSGNGIEIQDLGGPHHHSLHPARSISSLRSNSPAPGNSRSGSPNAGGRSRSVSAVGMRSRSNSALGARPGSSAGNRPGSSAGNRPGSSLGNRPGSSLGVRGRERSSSLLQSPPLTSPPTAMRGGHDGTSRERPNLTPFQPLMYQKPSGRSPSTGPSPPGGSRPPSRGQGANRPPSRPGSSHSAVGGIRRSASRLSFTESAFDVSETASSADAPPPKPLGLAGPKGKQIAISPENQAWVEGMIGEVRKVSAHNRRRRLTGGSNNGDMGLGDEGFVVPGELVEVQPASTAQQFGRLEISDMGKQGGTRRVFPKKG